MIFKSRSINSSSINSSSHNNRAIKNRTIKPGVIGKDNTRPICKEKIIDKKRIKKILLIQLGDIGDLVLTLPAILTLKQTFAGAFLAVGVREKAAALLYDCPEVDRVFSVDKFKKGAKNVRHQLKIIKDLIQWDFDLVVELRTGTRGAVLALLSMASYRVGRFDHESRLRNLVFTHLVDPDNEENQHSIDHNLNILSPLNPVLPAKPDPYIHINKKIKEKVMQKLDREGVKHEKFIVLHPFSIWQYKELSTGQYVKLIHHISDVWNCRLVITGSNAERDRARKLITASKRQAVNMAGKTSIIEMAGVLQQAVLVVSIDTSAIHIAAAVNTPTISIFGPSSPVNWAPGGSKKDCRHIVITNDMECIPCRKKGCFNSEKSRCLLTMDTGIIIAAIDGQIKKLDLIKQP